MLRTKWIVMSLAVLISFSTFTGAANQSYVVSFIGGPSGLGLVPVTQTGTVIQAGLPSITPMSKTMGSTAIDSFMGYWDYGGASYYVWVINRGNAEKPLEVSIIKFGEDLQPHGLGTFSKIPGEYHPLHVFRETEIDSGGDGIPDATSLLTTGTFGTSGANNYVSYSVGNGAKKKIFVNPDNRSPGTAAVAPDGGLVSQMTFKGLNHIGLIGKLINGNLADSPFEWLNANDFRGYSQSLSNPIESTHRNTSQKKGTRYLAYRNFKQPGISESQSQVLIQNVDATTGKPQGSPRAITKFATSRNVRVEKLQSIAISPDGRLILYTAWDDSCKKQILLARSLANGASVGNPVVLVGCGQLNEYPLGVYGINITPACPRVDYHSFCP